MNTQDDQWIPVEERFQKTLRLYWCLLMMICITSHQTLGREIARQSDD